MATTPPSGPDAGGDDGRTPITGAALSKEVTEALKAAGFTWVQGVALKRKPRKPNWDVARLMGRPPAGTQAVLEAMRHPLIKEMQRKYVLVAG